MNSQSYSAGIGGSIDNSTGNIEISGGVVEAVGGGKGPGIGCGGKYRSGNSLVAKDITISGGTVTAKGGNYGAGIGGGDNGSGSNITIRGGNVKANSIGAQPTDGNENNVYLLTISNGNDETVVIDDKVYAPVNQKAADPEDGNLYAYLTGESHIVNIGKSRYTYEYDINNGFVLTYDMEITFTDENNEVIGTVYAYSDEDISALAPDVPEKEDIAGKWDTDLSTITESCTVKAVYQIKVTFVDENNEVIDTVYAYADEDISALAPEIPEKDGYTGAWDTDLGAITESCTVKAVYTEIHDESSEESSDVSSEESSDITSDESSDVTSDSNTESGISDESAGSSDTESVSDSSSDSADVSKADSSASGSSDKNPSTGAAAGAAAVLLIGAGVAVLKKRG